MRAFHRATTDIEARANYLVYTESFGPHSSANNIHDGINRTDLVEVNGLHRHIMNLRLSRAEGVKDRDRSILG